MERREAADVLQIQRIQKQKSANRGEQADRDRAGAGEWRASEEPDLEERLAAAQFVEDQDHEADGRDREQREDLRRGPAQAVSLDDRVGQRRERNDHQHLSDRVKATGARSARARYEQRRQHDRNQADRQVHEKHRAPAPNVDQGAADDRAERHADAEDRAPDADRLRALARILEDVAHDRHRDRIEHRAADRLKYASADQQTEARGQRAQQRGEREHDQPGLERPLAADPVGRRARQHQQAREHQCVGVDRPLKPRDRRVQRLVDRRQRHVHDRRIEADDQQAHRADREDQQSPSASKMLRRARVPRARVARLLGRRGHRGQPYPQFSIRTRAASMSGCSGRSSRSGSSRAAACA